MTSTATKGPCTDTAGYISNAEIQDIINTPGRVNYNYVDEKSHSNILVYDNTQWVGWMSPEIKARRSTMYQMVQMGGIAEWAIDLETFHSAPDSGQPNNPSRGGTDSWWSIFKDNALTGGGSGPVRGNRTGNWTQVQCSDRAVWDWDHMTQAERWAEVDAKDAFADAVQQWKTYDRDHKYTFSKSVLDTFHGPDENKCHLLKNGCDETQVCTAFVGQGTGPAAYLIYNSFVMIHRVSKPLIILHIIFTTTIIPESHPLSRNYSFSQSFNSFNVALHGEASTAISFGIDAFIDKFAPLPPEDDNKLLFFIIDIITLGATAGMGKVFNSCKSGFLSALF